MEPQGDSSPLAPREYWQSSVFAKAALILISAPMLWVAIAWMQKDLPLSAAEWRIVFPTAGAAFTFILLAAVFLPWAPRLAAGILTVGVTAAMIPLALRARQSPDVVFTGFCWGVILAYFTCSRPFPAGKVSLPPASRLPAVFSPAVMFSGSAALLLAAFSSGHRVMDSSLGFWAVASLLVTSTLLSTLVEWVMARRGALERRRAWVLTAVTVAGLVFISRPALGMTILGLRQAASIAGATRANEAYGAAVAYLWRRSSLMVVSTFLLLSLAGGLVLTFPACTARPIAPLDALFTSTSACCVTGLTVLDTPGDFTFVGQLLILIMIQVGGLGIMTLSAVAVLILGGDLPSVEEEALGQVVGAATPGSTLRLVKVIAGATLLVEGLGALLLFPAFLLAGGEHHAAAESLWKAVFHSVSAFCNAGFALQSTSLLEYRDNPYIMNTVGILILLGGIGFSVLVGLADRLRRSRRRRLSLHAKLVLTTSGLLLLGGFLVFLFLEWNASLAGESVAGKLQGAWFQSITPRTAGFNSVDLGSLQPATVLLFMVLMLVGASPVSTGGGIKTTTAAVLLLAVRSTVRRSGGVEAFGRRIPRSVVYRAAAVLTLSLTTVALGSLVLLSTQEAPFESLVFESVSAFGTVGLSLGATAVLDSVGKLVVICLMLVGRTGPLTLVLLFRQQRHRLRFPREDVIVG